MLLKLQKIILEYQEKHFQEYQDLSQRKAALKKSKKKLETSKLVLWFMLILLLAIVVFTGFITLQMMSIVAATGLMMDFTPLVALITAIVGQVIITLGYFLKSAKENSKNGIVFETAMNEQQDIGGVG